MTAPLFALYCVSAVAWFICYAIAAWAHGQPRFARNALMAPVWPLVPLVALIRLAVKR